MKMMHRLLVLLVAIALQPCNAFVRPVSSPLIPRAASSSLRMARSGLNGSENQWLFNSKMWLDKHSRCCTNFNGISKSCASSVQLQGNDTVRS